MCVCVCVCVREREREFITRLSKCKEISIKKQSAK